MDDRRFDSLVRMLGAGGSRRTVLKGLLGLGGAAVVGSTLVEGDTDAARRPTPTPIPARCPGKQTRVNGVCICQVPLAPGPHECGPDCCTGTGDESYPRPAGHSECCDNACCFGTCYGEELCCATNLRPGEQPPLQQVCTSASGVECCPYQDACCGVDGCCDTVCWGGETDNDFCCPEQAYCPGNDSPDLCCTNNFTCCGGGTSANACLDLTREGVCCTDADCQANETCIANQCSLDDPDAPCQPGFYREEGVCTPCAGGFASADGITCERCGPGTAAPAGSDECQECEPGYYTDDSENDACNTCPPGWYAPDTGSTECTACPAGAYSDTDAATACMPCPADTYVNAERTGCIACDCQAGNMPDVCECLPPTCAPGYYVDGGDCVACSAGSYSEFPDSVSCQFCDLHTYQDLPAQSGCLPCAAGFYTEHVGSTMCIECNCAQGDMPMICDCGPTPCDAGSAPDGFGMCAECYPGSASFDGSACVPCTAGRFASGYGNVACSPCDQGTYADDIGAAICDACPAGSFASTAGAVGCSPCDCGASCNPVTGTCGSVGVGGPCSSNAECASDVCGCGSPPGLPECMCRFDTCWATGVECSSGYGAISCCEGDCLCTGGGCFCTAAG